MVLSDRRVSRLQQIEGALPQNLHARRAPNIKSISVVSQRGTRRVIHGETADGQISSRVDAHELNGRVQKLKAGNG